MANFHFIRPELFLLLIPSLLFLIWQNKHKKSSQSLQEIVDKPLFKYVVKQSTIEKKNHYWLPILMTFIAVFSISGPTWEKKPTPIFVDQSALIIALDLSQSMLAEDVRPSRLARAKFIIQDILNKKEAGQFALIAFANEAFVVTPFSNDKATIIQQLHALNPDIMPVQGTNFLDVVKKAETLNINNNLNQSRLLIITDTLDHLNKDELESDIVEVSILAISKTQGAPIPSNEGQFIKDSKGNIVISQLNQKVASALNGLTKIRFRQLNNSDTDLAYLLPQAKAKIDKKTQRESSAWIDQGALFAWLLLPYLLLFFRKGLIYGLVFLILPVPQADANEMPNWMLNKNQKAQKYFEKKDYARAAEQFDDRKWKASSLYKNKDYAKAEEIWKNMEDSVSDYNAGNAAAKQNNLDDAIKFYKKALKKQPDLQRAKDNLKIVENLKKQQEQNQKQQNKSSEDKQEKNNSDQNQEKNKKNNKNKDSKQKQNEKNQNKDSKQNEEQEKKTSKQDKNIEEQKKATKDKKEQQPKDEKEKALDKKESNTLPEEGKQKQLNKTQQWLQKIPDNPGGLLRRKFYYYSQQNRQQESKQPW